MPQVRQTDIRLIFKRLHQSLGTSTDHELDSHTEKNYFFRAISIAYKPPCPIRGFSHGSVGLEEVLHPKLLPRFLMLASMRRITVVLEFGARQRLAASLR